MANDQIIQEKANDILKKLKGIGIEHVYIDPPENIRMSYPCARVRLNIPRTRYADNRPHIVVPSWEIIYMSYEPDDEYLLKIMDAFQMISANRHYASDGLHHYPFILYK